jgi:cytochrome c553
MTPATQPSTHPDSPAPRHGARARPGAAAALLALLALPAAAADTDAEQAVSGERIYAYCVACHGQRGEGGGGGRFPRIAGLPQPYIDRHLHAFRDQTRSNKPMVPIFTHHRFDDEVIAVVAGHIAAMSPPALGLWPYTPSPDALAAFADRAAYDAAGAETYQRACAECHGADAAGSAEHGTPPLVGQYPAYLIKQIGDFARGERQHAASGQCGGIAPATADAVVSHIVELGK